MSRSLRVLTCHPTDSCAAKGKPFDLIERIVLYEQTFWICRRFGTTFPSGRPHLGRRGALGRRGMRREGESAGRWLGDG
jgi:hypothetical protein